MTVALGRAGVGGLVGSLFRVQYLVSTLEENASPPCSSSCLPLRIQKWFDLQSNMILCCVVRGLLPLADHLLFEAMELGSVQPFLRFIQKDRGTRARRALCARNRDFATQTSRR